MTRAPHPAWALVLALTLAACAAFEGATPETPEQALAATYSTIEAVATTAKARLEAGALTRDQAAAVSVKLHDAREGADIARDLLSAGRTGEATGRLEAVAAILTALERELGP